jgi:hypothetical protein
LALSSLSRSSRYVALFWIGMWFVTSSVATVLSAISFEQQFHDRHRAEVAGEATPDELAADQRDWRPLISYTANLRRIGEQLMGTGEAWTKIMQIHPERHRDDRLRVVLGPRSPWYWAAGVLLALAGLSICILNLRIKSLDRLK